MKRAVFLACAVMGVKIYGVDAGVAPPSSALYNAIASGTLAGSPMHILLSFLLTLHVLVCLLMVVVVLMQRPRSEGLGAAFGSGMTDNIFGAQTTNVLARFTTWLGGAFFALTLALAVVYAHLYSGNTGIERELSKLPAPTAAAAPAARPEPKPVGALPTASAATPAPAAAVQPAAPATPAAPVKAPAPVTTAPNIPVESPASSTN